MRLRIQPMFVQARKQCKGPPWLASCCPAEVLQPWDRPTLAVIAVAGTLDLLTGHLLSLLLCLQLMRNKYWDFGYEEIVTPNIYNLDLWKTSGHAEHYKQNMFLIDIEKAEFGMKPMNCPGGTLFPLGNAPNLPTFSQNPHPAHHCAGRVVHFVLREAEALWLCLAAPHSTETAAFPWSVP